jgi:hypothetical protein
MEYYLEDGVEVEESAAQTEILEAAAKAYDDTEQRLVVTSGNEGHPGDGVHSRGSHHYAENTPEGAGGWALDLRIWDLENPSQVARDLRVELGLEYDVVYGDHHDTHIHVERDP